MFRTQRDTGKWFNNDDKGQLRDKKYIAAMAPGVYNPTKQPLGDKAKKISWNFGSVPFGTCNERFKSEMRTIPGPGTYEQDVLQLTKPVPSKFKSPKTSPTNSMSRTFHVTPLVAQSTGDMSINASSKHLTKKQMMNQSLVESQQSWAFKSREPKIAIYRDEEKRISGLYGRKKGLKYKIKLNDKILDSAKDNKSPLTKGKIALGKTIEPNPLMLINVQKMNEKKEKDDIFGTQGKLHLGPGDY